MGRPCLACNHPDVQAIDAALAAGRSARSLGLAYGLSADAVLRHARSHALAGQPTASDAPAGADALAELVESLRPIALAGRSPTISNVYRMALGALQERQAVPTEYNVLTDARYLRVRAVLVAALRPFPAAALAVADALRAVEAEV